MLEVIPVKLQLKQEILTEVPQSFDTENITPLMVCAQEHSITERDEQSFLRCLDRDFTEFDSLGSVKDRPCQYLRYPWHRGPGGTRKAPCGDQNWIEPLNLTIEISTRSHGNGYYL